MFNMDPDKNLNTVILPDKTHRNNFLNTQNNARNRLGYEVSTFLSWGFVRIRIKPFATNKSPISHFKKQGFGDQTIIHSLVTAIHSQKKSRSKPPFR